MKLIERLARANLRAAWGALLCGALFASPARGAGDEAFDGSGEAVVPGGGMVSFTGASSTNWIDGELVLPYTNATAATFTLPGLAAARILAVGGGGDTATAGAQVKNADVKEVLDRLVESIDRFYED